MRQILKFEYIYIGNILKTNEGAHEPTLATMCLRLFVDCIVLFMWEGNF